MRLRRVLVFVAAAGLAACATAGDDPDGGGGGDVDAGATRPDAGIKPPADASTLPDAKPGAPDAAPLPDVAPGTPDAALPPDAMPVPDAGPTPDAGPGDCVVSGVLTFDDTTSTPIPDSSTITRTIAVSGADPSLARVAVSTSITHTYPDDLDITLISPAGTRVLITSDNGDGNNDVFDGTLWSDAVNQPATDYVYTDGVAATELTPESALAALVGENPNGTWTLEVTDDAGFDTGTLSMWSLEIAALPAAPSYDSTTATSSPSLALPDVATATDTLSMSGATTDLCDLRLTTAITHTYNGDLEIVLISPSGTRVAVSTGNGGSADDVYDGTLWDDGANAPASDHAFTSGVTATPLTVESALAAFAGEDPNGTWTLEITDTAGGDVGTLGSWTVDALGCTCP